MRKCPICKQKYEPKYSSIEPCGSYECRLVLYERANKKLKAKAEKERKEKEKAERLLKKQMRESLKTKSDYEKDLQTEINQIVKYIDHTHPCISSYKSTGKRNAGHYYATTSQPAIRFHLFNIYNQSEYDNTYKSGNPIGYREGILSTFGKDHLEYVEELKNHPPLKLSIPELKEAIQKARIIVKELKTEDRVYSTQERLSLRREFNARIGIYQ